jgi:hypothetical protein
MSRILDTNTEIVFPGKLQTSHNVRGTGHINSIHGKIAQSAWGGHRRIRRTSKILKDRCHYLCGMVEATRDIFGVSMIDVSPAQPFTEKHGKCIVDWMASKFIDLLCLRHLPGLLQYLALRCIVGRIVTWGSQWDTRKQSSLKS